MRKLTAVLAAVAVLLLAGGAVLRWVVVPSQLKLPGSTDVSRDYSGTVQQMVDTQAAAAGKLDQALLKNVPAAIKRTVTVVKTDGNKAVVQDTQVLRASANDRVLAATTHYYAVDRSNLGGASGIANMPKGTIVPTGLTVSFPFDTKKHGYTGYVTDTGRTTTVQYTGTAKRNGLTTYVFTDNVPAATITDPVMLSSLPPAIPKAQLTALAPLLGIPAAQLTQLAALFAALPDPVPISYTYQVRSTYWVDPLTGMVVDMNRSENRAATVTVPGTSTVVTLAPVLTESFAMTAGSVTDGVNDAKWAHTKVLLMGTVLPIVLGVIGIVLLAVAPMARRRPTAMPPVPPRERVPAA